ncbi:MAG: LON peptidase substrate-binding domain-containing protein [Chloroflexi bacterium]|nr:LON peptidase substrate-binding domain-containing protein [Chloroflexota bacterium]GIW11024.1 MAG: peptidase S16 [Dehalococcoidia bacterium]
MSSAILDLALFPLNSVLFPGGQIALHIFEPRYRLMIGRCIEENLPFGVVLIRAGHEVGEPATPYEVGTVASINKYTRKSDGKYDLTALGLERFRILTVLQERPYLVARVQLLPDEPSPTAELTLRAREAASLFESYVERLRELSQGRLDLIEVPNDPEALAWFIAATLPLALAEKQTLLELPSTAARLASEAEILRRELTFLRFGALSVEDRNRLLARPRSLN